MTKAAGKSVCDSVPYGEAYSFNLFAVQPERNMGTMCVAVLCCARLLVKAAGFRASRSLILTAHFRHRYALSLAVLLADAEVHLLRCC